MERSGKVELDDELWEDIEGWRYEDDDEEWPAMRSKGTAYDDEVLPRQIRRAVSQTSRSTSLNSKDLATRRGSSVSAVAKLVQTLGTRRPARRTKRGTLENHSFTKLKQRVLDEFCFKCLPGSIDQGNENFSAASRDKQGVCVPAAAFCHAALRKPKTWTERSVDEVVEAGDALYLESVPNALRGDAELTPQQLNNFLYIGNRKVKFEIDEPEIHGYVRSTDRRVYNVTKGLRLFFRRHRAAIFQAGGVNLAIWRRKKYYYVFDGRPRRKDLCVDPSGTAILIWVKGVKSIASILLDRSELVNPPFLLSRVRVVRVYCPGEKEEEDDDRIDRRSDYNILSEKKAVVLGSFDLGDKRFCFSRNKQAMAMAVVCMVYSRIASPNGWRRKTVDKIMTVGNALYLECARTGDVIKMGVEHLPAVFTVGPYIVEIHVYANVASGPTCKKCQCCLLSELEAFFAKNAHAVVQVGKLTVAIWSQRNKFYCFDPHPRDEEGLKCRRGVACVSMNLDLDTVADTVMSNLDDADAPFALHALKITRVTRDPAMGRLFPKTRRMDEVPLEHFRRCKVRRSRKKAVEKPIRANFAEYAMRKLLADESPAPSVTDVASNLGDVDLPEYLRKSRPSPVEEVAVVVVETGKLADLDSPALSETQIVPERPPHTQPEEISFFDLEESFDLTQEELELQVETAEGELDDVEGGGEEIMLGSGDYEEQGEMYDDDYYTAMSRYSQVGSSSLDSLHLKMSEEVNTEITYQYRILPALELPLTPQFDRMVIDDELQEAELEKETNYRELKGEAAQILRGRTKLEEPANEVAPYVCIMATAYALEKPVNKWSSHTVDFVLTSGFELYQSFEEPYHKIDDFNLEFAKHTVELTLEIVLDTYVGQQVFQTDAGRKALESLLESHVFSKSPAGLIFLQEYCCAVFLKRNLLYLFDCFGCDETCKAGGGCVLRFRELESLASRILRNRNRRVRGCPEYTHFVLAVPNAIRTPESKKQRPEEEESVPVVTQSQELGGPHNFADMPDDTQLLRGTVDIGGFDLDDSELLEAAPYVCMMAAAASSKYSVATWSTEIVDYVLQGGFQLYKKVKVRFDRVTRLEIPMVSLGKMNFNLEVNYLFDAPMKAGILEAALKRILRQGGDWCIVATQEFVCTTYLKNDLYYLYDGFPTNEVGLSEGPDAKGFASLARFKDLHAMVNRIVYNKSKREEPEQLEYTRFALSICRARFLRPAKTGRAKAKGDEFEVQEPPKEEGEGEVETPPRAKEEEEDATKPESPKNKVGFQVKGKFLVIEATSSLDGRDVASPELKVDHFVCLCACLMVLERPVTKWSTKRVDKVMEQGKHVFSHAENLEPSDKRTIKNILVGKHYFDIVVKPIKINDWKNNRNLTMGLKTIMDKRKFCLVQLPNCCVVVYRDGDVYFVFDPYSWKHKDDTVQAGWTVYDSFARLKRKVASCQIRDARYAYAFYSFEMTAMRKAPRKVLLEQKLEQYRVSEPRKPEIPGKPFHERKSWLDIHLSPWSRIKPATADGKARGSREAKWRCWDVEYPDDLYSLAGTIHQTSRRFEPENRGKQTLANMVVAIAMTKIYELSEWNSSILDSILVNGDAYFVDCVKDIGEDNYELALDDLVEDCSVFPYSFKVSYAPVVSGTMFLAHEGTWDLYRALRYFFDGYECRSGAILADKGAVKRMVSFGKVRGNEYFVYDCQAIGPPMFLERKGVSYALRCVTMARLLHCLVLTLNGGDFFVYEVETYDFLPMKEETEADK